MPQRPLLASLAIACLTLGASCFNEAKAPSVVPTRTLGLPVEARGATRSGPLTVFLGSSDPVGLVFDRPMQTSEAIAADLSIPGGTRPAGAWRWVGETAVVFSPSMPLPLATELAIHLPAGARALDGSTLAAPFDARLSTSRPALASIEPRDGLVSLSPTFELRFDQAIAPDEVERAVRLSLSDEKRKGDASRPVSFRVARVGAGGGAASAFALTPSDPLPPGATLSLEVSDSLHGVAGPLPSGRAERFTFRSRGPLSVMSARRIPSRASGKCAASGVELELSTPVTVGELAAHVRIDPPVPITWNRAAGDALSRVDIHAPLAPARTYTVSVAAGMKDVFGQALGATSTHTLAVGSEPLLHIDDAEVLAADGPLAVRSVAVESANVSAYDLLAVPLDEGGLVRYLVEASPGATDPLAEASRLFPQGRISAVRRSSAFAPPEIHAVAVDALLSRERGHGAALVVAETEGPTRSGTHLTSARLATRTDLRLTARVGLKGGVVWVSHLSTGRPAAGAVVVVRDPTGAEVATARADDSGMAFVTLDARALAGDGGAVDPRAVLVARAGDDWTFRPLADALEEPCREPAPAVESLTGVVFTDRPSYAPGDTLFAKVLFRETQRGGDVAPRGRPVRVTATRPGGDAAASVDGRLDSYGGFTAELHVPPAERPGRWSLRAEPLLQESGAAAEPSAAGGPGSVATTSVAIGISTSPGLAPSPGGPIVRAANVPGGAAAAGAARADRVALSADRDAYAVGDTATVRIESPFRDAEAFVTVEGAGATRGERLRIVGGVGTLRVPITAAMVPAGYVSALLTRVGADDGRSYDGLAVGRTRLGVSGPAVGLRVAISPVTASPAPGELFESEVRVTDAAGTPVRASVAYVAVVDAPAPVRPLQAFEAPRPPVSYWVDSRGDMGRPVVPGRTFEAVSSPPDEPASGPGAEGPGRTAFFDGSVLTDVAGKARVRFQVPARCSVLRVWAVAATEDSRFGSGDASVDTSPTLGLVVEGPAVVRAGDDLEVRATLRSRGAGPRPVDVTVAGIGVVLNADARRRLVLPPGEAVETRFRVLAGEVGRAELVVSARAADATADAAFVRRVIAPSTPETVVYYGESSDAAADRLGDLAGIRPDVGALDLKASVTPLVGLDDGVEQILEYPYEDTDQHGTRLVALTAMPDLLKDFGVLLPQKAALADREIGALLDAERPDGSFGAWSGAGEGAAAAESVAFRTANALWALNAASIHDHKVPDAAIRRAVEYVRRSLASWDRSPHETAEAALALDVLTDLGLGDGDIMLAIHAVRARLPVFVRALLAHAMSVQQMDDSKVEEVLGDLDSHLRTTAEGSVVVEDDDAEYRPLHESSARATAMVLRALVSRAKARAPNVFRKIKPSDLTARVARGLLSLRRGGVWRTPQETVWALRALDDFRAAHVLNHPDVDALFYLDDVLLLKMPLHERKAWQASATFGMPKVARAGAPGATLGFRVEGDGTVRYEARVRFYRANLGEPGVDRGIAVDRRILTPATAAGAPQDPRPGVLHRGQTVRLELLVATPVPRDDVVLDDPLPGGLVASPASFHDLSGGVPARVEAVEGRVVTRIGHLPAGISVLRYDARAVDVGRFVVPAARATCLYEPEVFGRTAASAVEVVP